MNDPIRGSPERGQLCPPLPAFWPSAGFRRWHAAVLLAALWTSVGTMFALNAYLARAVSTRPAPLWVFLAWMVPSWNFFLFATPAVAALVRRFPIDRVRWRRHAPVLLAAGLALTVFMALWDLLLLRTLGAWLDLSPIAGAYADRPSAELLRYLFAYDHPLAMLVYFGLVAVIHAFAYQRDAIERANAAEQLEARLSKAHLDLLQVQLQPHFLFNTLHTISSLMHIDIEAADRTVVALSDLLRMTIENGRRHEVPLKQEIEFIARYLEIERTRFQERLDVEIDVEPDTLDALVPSMILQPLVENAVRHGIGPRAVGGRVRVAASAHAGQLRLIVSDNGPGMPPPSRAAARAGIGLANTRARLDELYGASHRFLLQRPSGAGLQATLVIPLRTSSEDAGVSLHSESARARGHR
ncbi:MAG: sensor histidine kinase [Acidobacteriota bacterium]